MERIQKISESLRRNRRHGPREGIGYQQRRRVPFLEQHSQPADDSRTAQVGKLAQRARHDDAANVVAKRVADCCTHVVYSGISTSSGMAPAASACRAASAHSRAVRLASHVLPDPGPPSTTSRARRLAMSASRSCPLPP